MFSKNVCDITSENMKWRSPIFIREHTPDVHNATTIWITLIHTSCGIFLSPGFPYTTSDLQTSHWIGFRQNKQQITSHDGSNGYGIEPSSTGWFFVLSDGASNQKPSAYQAYFMKAPQDNYWIGHSTWSPCCSSCSGCEIKSITQMSEHDIPILFMGGNSWLTRSYTIIHRSKFLKSLTEANHGWMMANEHPCHLAWTPTGP